MSIIYKATNKINGKSYIGQTIKSLNKRIIEHLSITKKGYNFPFHNALRKYGAQSFEWSIIDTSDDKEILNEKEEYWISYLNTKVPNGYNIADGGNVQGMSKEGRKHLSEFMKSDKNPSKMPEARKLNSEFHKIHHPTSKGKHWKVINRKIGKRNKHSDETKSKISKSRRGIPAWNKGLRKDTDRRVRAISEKLLGYKQSDEHKEKNRVWHLNKVVSDITRKQMSAAQRRRYRHA